MSDIWRTRDTYIEDGLRELLLEYTVSYLLFQKNGISEHTHNYLTKSSAPKHTFMIHPTRPSNQSKRTVIMPPSKRRYSVSMEVFSRLSKMPKSSSTPYIPKSDFERRKLAKDMKNIVIFKHLDAGELDEVIDAMHEEPVRAGQVVIKQGDETERFFVVKNGEFEVSVINSASERRVVYRYSNRGSFGELSLLYNVPMGVTVEALTDGSLWIMDRPTFHQILFQNARKMGRTYRPL